MKRVGYYPGLSTLSQQDFWDDATRKVVLSRIHEVPPIRFFTAEELPLVTAIYDRVMPQSDRPAELRIPVVSFVDERLHLKRFDGYRFEKMPPDDEAHRLGLVAIETIARRLHDRGFVELPPLDRDRILDSIRAGEPAAAHDIWARMPIAHYWALLVQDGVQAYYAHPYAWDEIGFGGPAYPRGYMRLENGLPEPWEVEEQRYEWREPDSEISERYHPITEASEDGESGGHTGQGGTH